MAASAYPEEVKVSFVVASWSKLDGRLRTWRLDPGVPALSAYSDTRGVVPDGTSSLTTTSVRMEARGPVVNGCA